MHATAEILRCAQDDVYPNVQQAGNAGMFAPPIIPAKHRGCQHAGQRSPLTIGP